MPTDFDSTCTGCVSMTCGPWSPVAGIYHCLPKIASSTTSSAMPKATPSMQRNSCAHSRRKSSCASWENRWELDEIDRVILPPYLSQVIEGRVARLGEEMRQPLAMAAVIGQEVPLDLWARVMGLDEEELLPIIEHAVGAHLLEAEFVGTRVRFVHALTREALYEGILPPRRRVWHRQVGEALWRASVPNLTPWPTTSSKQEIRVPVNGWFVLASARNVPMPG